MKKAVKSARIISQSLYVDRPLPGGGVTKDRVDVPVTIARYPYLCVDYVTRELCVTATVRLPLEKVEYYELVEATGDDLEWEKLTAPKAAKAKRGARANAA